MHLLCGPVIQQHSAECRQAVPSSPVRCLDALQEVDGGNDDPEDHSDPVGHFLAASNQCFRLNMFAVTERLAVLTLQRSCWGWVSADLKTSDFPISLSGLNTVTVLDLIWKHQTCLGHTVCTAGSEAGRWALQIRKHRA